MKSPWCFSLKQRFMEEGMEESTMAAGKRKQAARVGGLIWREIPSLSSCSTSRRTATGGG
jgi:hypothetical protein